MKDIDKKIKELEKELKDLKKKAKEEPIKETTVDRSDKMKGGDHKLKVTIYDETNDEKYFDGYVKGGIIALISEENPNETYATAYTNCSASDINHMLNGVEKISNELRDRLIKNLTKSLFDGFKDLLEGDNDNE